MPLKSGKLTYAERRVVEAYALTGDQGYAAQKAGISQPGASMALARPAVQAEIARRHEEMLFNDILPLAVAAHKRILSDPRAPAGAVVQAVKLAYDRTLGSEDGGRAKEPHEMTGDELASAINTLERIAAERAKPVQLEGSAIVEEDIFG